ncbi:uncharacterized protein LACBIDRAFT_293531 [Laccaria bicolor S238N-H82]|uniref:Predicted protein n=1 Tax=Laccaria bicolor (strain S238N-H82 / ATCC MYA-4686) TaxID=486041 RepID=B0D590_LACBS|nr:uncharacterized protein LACBIDRAFT_293531 [Laccaria bicolor S238N-H82]EDR10237.1 predicted protein [Laccaria bicolor S238N-H82]|eukprot:XP_001878687.1 predicted protein [Laccaria bicolor S238N-H82]
MPPDATLPPIRRVLKRSASTASLPTPPRTHSKRGRGRSRGSCDSDSDDQVVLLSDEEELAVSVHKKRRTGEATQEGEDAFWLGTGGLTTRSKRAFGSSNSKAVDPSTQAPLIYRRRQAQAQQLQPVSPPPSHRKPMVVSPTNNPPTTPLRTSPRFARAPSTASPPVTPKRKSQRRTTSVLRDSPQNPFLASPLDAVPESDSEESPNQSPKTPYQEKPTVAYVFRGMRREFHNPLYNPITNRPISPPRGSKLPVEHPAFSPDPSCPPKLLFPEAHKRRTAAKGKAKAKGGNGDDVFGGGDPVKPRSRGATTLDKELRKAGER